MEQLVDDLLTLARSEAQARGRCDPARVAAQVAQELRSGIEQPGGTLRLAVAHAEVTCSEGLLRQALANLIQNAVKYRRPDAPLVVDLSGAVADGRYVLRVSDNGAGMSEEEAAHAAEPFYRSPRMHEVPGTGLGLAIVSRVAKASGGALSIETRLGEGSTFVIELPLLKGD
jgi:signal transduction histidine kinase